MSFINNANAEIMLYGEAKYNVQSAKNEVSSNIQLNINPQQFYQHILDKNYQENQSAILKGNLKLKDRQLAIFSNGR